MAYKLITHVIHFNLRRGEGTSGSTEGRYDIVDTKIIETDHATQAEMQSAKEMLGRTYQGLTAFPSSMVRFTELKIDKPVEEVVPLMRIGNLLFDPTLVASASRYAHADESLKGIYVYLLGENRDNGGHFVKMDTDEQIQEALDKIHRARINGVMIG